MEQAVQHQDHLTRDHQLLPQGVEEVKARTHQVPQDHRDRTHQDHQGQTHQYLLETLPYFHHRYQSHQVERERSRIQKSSTETEARLDPSSTNSFSFPLHDHTILSTTT